MLGLAVSCAWSAQQFEFATPQVSFARKKSVRADLFLSHEVAKPGDTVMAAIKLTHAPGWHTYWRNPGDSGTATEIYWALSNGITAGLIQWPVPEKFVDATVGLTTYVYHSNVVLLVPLKIAPDAPAGTNEVNALAKWLQCEKSCIPGSNSLRASLIIGTESRMAADTNVFAEAQRRMPSQQLQGTASARWDAPESMAVRPLVIDWSVEAKSADFFPFTNALVAISNKTDVSAGASNVVLRKLAKSKDGTWPKEVAGLLVREEKGSLEGYEVSLPLPSSGDGAATASSANVGFQGEKKSLAVWLLYAFVGGLILNIMPCVLPVIALKILGFVKQSQDHPKQVRKLGILYTLGVVASFLVLAGIVIGVKAAGQRAGWGMQFSNPQFIVILAVIVTLVALNLFGVFEITLGGGAMGAASEAASKKGSAGAFMNGVLATVLATPCTAPFLGAALGFAFVQPAPVIVLMFVTIALGLALPYLLLSWNPAWLKFLPKPGAWMERFKVAMGFPMLATAIWLFTLTQIFYGKRIWWLGVFLVVVALAAWVYGEFVQRGRKRRTAAVVIVLVLLAVGFAYAVEHKLDWRNPNADAGSSTWSPEAVARARAEGHPVVVDFTADWCVTCNTIVKPALESARVQAKLKEANGVLLIADNTKFPPAIAAELEKYGRAGVPMVLVFPRDISKPAIVIPESGFPGTVADNVIKALEEGAK